MFPCKQRDNTQEYRDNYDSIFKLTKTILEETEQDSCYIREDKHGTERKSRLHTNKR